MFKHYLIAFLLSLVPLIELRGALPYTQAVGMPIIVSLVLCSLANILPVPFIFLFARKILIWGSNKPKIGSLFRRILAKGERAGDKLVHKSERGLFVALLLFVGIPLPGTGAWTGTLAASILNLKFKQTILAVSLGVMLAAVIMGFASYGLFALFR